MFIEARKLIGLPVAAQDSQSKIGRISQILVDPQNGRLLGFLVQEGGFFSAKKALSIVDVREWDPNGLVTTSVENLVPPAEIIRLREILAKKIFLLGMKAKTEQGKSLGLLEDFLIDTGTESVTKYYLKDLLGKARVLPSDKVVRIDKTIIFADDVGEPPTGAVGAAA